MKKYSFYQRLFDTNYTALWKTVRDGNERICLVTSSDNTNRVFLCTCVQTNGGLVIADDGGNITLVSKGWKDFYFYCQRHQIKFLHNEAIK